MAQEPQTGLARAPEPQTDTDATKEELQRRMEEARESITQTVAEIKDTVATQYQQVRESISESLDWREQFRRRPVAFIGGALGAGLVLGYSVGGAFTGGSDDDDREDFDDSEDLDASISASNLGAITPSRSYAAQAITGGAHGSSDYERSVAPSAYAAAVFPPGPTVTASSPLQDVGPDSRQAFQSNYGTDAGTADEAGKPGIFQRVKESGVIDKFKETKAYDRLQEEIGSLGDRFVEELSSTARNVVLPALLGKLKDMIGIDLSTQREVAQRSKLEHQTSNSRAGAEAASEGMGDGASGGAATSAATGSVG